MIRDSLLLIPDHGGIPPGHWLAWLAEQLPGSREVPELDSAQAVLAHWAETIRRCLAETGSTQTLVAHGFGCLAAVVAVADRPDRVDELILVAPADAASFDCTGPRTRRSRHEERFLLDQVLPHEALGPRGLLVASRDDPGLCFEAARELAARWGLDFVDAGPAGHLDVAAGYGPWPWLFKQLQTHKPAPGSVARTMLRRGRGSHLAALRQLTRKQWETLPASLPPMQDSE